VIIQCNQCGAKYRLKGPALPTGRLACQKCQSPLSPHALDAAEGGGTPDPTGIQRSPTGAPLNSASGLRLCLVVQSGPDRGKTFPVTKDRIVIGRKTGDLILKDPEVSASHAAVEIVGTTYLVRDLQSTNGTYLNGEKVDESEVRHLDEIGVGKSILIFTVSQDGD
jgi:pSer/pThr/pTyr-binding forkhead associated (FHA) protein